MRFRYEGDDFLLLGWLAALTLAVLALAVAG